MTLIYDESAGSGGANISVSKMNATRQFLRHYENKLILSFFAKNGTRSERWQAEKELLICERKLSFWEKHPNFEPITVRKGMEELNRPWIQKGAH